MALEIKMIISVNNKEIDTVVAKTTVEPSYLIKSLEAFRAQVNIILTKMIDSQGGLDVEINEPEDAETSDDEIDLPPSPKIKKK